jgi:hypothetical protein
MESQLDRRSGRWQGWHEKAAAGCTGNRGERENAAPVTRRQIADRATQRALMRRAFRIREETFIVPMECGTARRRFSIRSAEAIKRKTGKRTTAK